MCAAPPPLQTEMPPGNSTGAIGRPEPTPPTPPPPHFRRSQLVQSPALTPAPPSLPPALVQPTAAAELAPAAFEPLAPLLPQTAMHVQPVTPMSLLLLPRRPATPPRFLTRNAAAWPAGPAPAPPRARAAGDDSPRAAERAAPGNFHVFGIHAAVLRRRRRERRWGAGGRRRRHDGSRDLDPARASRGRGPPATCKPARTARPRRRHAHPARVAEELPRPIACYRARYQRYQGVLR